MLSTLPPLRVGCVPEHFSAPIHLSPSLVVVSCPCGTGEMISGLHSSADGSIDVAVALTEGIILAAIKDLIANVQSPIQIVGSYTTSPLTWSIAIGPNSSIASTNQIKTVGISRYGSGSHIIAVLLSLTLGTPFEYVVCNSIAGLMASVISGETDCFLWEVITTKPYYDTGEIKMLDTITIPWPSFVVGALSPTPVRRDQLRALQIDLSHSIEKFNGTFQTEGKNFILQRKDLFHYKSGTDLETWFSQAVFAPDLSKVSRVAIELCVKTLTEAKLIDIGEIEKWEAEHGVKVTQAICNSLVVLE